MIAAQVVTPQPGLHRAARAGSENPGKIFAMFAPKLLTSCQLQKMGVLFF
jgi:hypothetical protein